MAKQEIFTKMFRHNLLSAIFIFFSLSLAFANNPTANKTRPESAFDKVLRQGELAKILSEVPNRLDLQLERLTAYFFHQKINQYRLDRNLNTLYWDDRMWLAARNHNLYLWKQNALTHEESKEKPFYSGLNPWDRMQYVTYNNYKMESFSENCLYFTDHFLTFEADAAMELAERALVQWKNSPGHNKNMLDPKHFAHGTSFIVAGVYLYATTNFGNASNFEVNEIAITWNDSLAKRFPPRKISKRKPFVAAKWSVMQIEKELFNVVKARMPKHTSAYNSDLAYAAEMGIKSKKEIENEQTEVEYTKLRYLKTAKDSKLKLILSKLHEKVYRFEFSIEQLQNKSAYKVIDDRISKDLSAATKIKNWGGKCVLTEKDKLYICDIDLIYVIDK